VATLNHPDIAAIPSEKRGGLDQSEKSMVAGAKPPFRLLFVDDEPDIREVTSAVLAQEGYEVLTAEDGQEALELLPWFRPDLVITDLRMPRMSGFELLDIMRERFPRLPVIAVSGEFSSDEIPPNVTADAFVSKGCSYIEPLAIKIKELLSTAALPRDPNAGNDPGAND
jgi:two-component system OmpR family response regulator